MVLKKLKLNMIFIPQNSGIKDHGQCRLNRVSFRKSLLYYNVYKQLTVKNNYYG